MNTNNKNSIGESTLIDFEDGVEMSLKIMQSAKNKDDGIQKLEGLLGCIKENKFECIEKKIGYFPKGM